MDYITYLSKLTKLGFETGKGNQNAFNEIFDKKLKKEGGFTEAEWEDLKEKEQGSDYLKDYEK